jgi:hypothetical protein
MLKVVMLFSIVIILNTATNAQSKSLLIELSDGSIRSIVLSEIRDITLSGTPTSVDERQSVQNILKTFTLYQNYPNPFNPETNLKYEIPNSGIVEISIFDIQGRIIRSFESINRNAGTHLVAWNGRSDSGTLVASGTYFCRVHFNGNYLINKLLLIK